jgi:hypothetical protein
VRGGFELLARSSCRVLLLTACSPLPLQAPTPDELLTTVGAEGGLLGPDIGALPPAAAHPFAEYRAAAAAAGIKVCENCGTTSTPLWRKDKQTGMMMCNACGIFFKHHQTHRPVELMLAPPRSHAAPQQPRPASTPSPAPMAPEDSEGEEGAQAAGWEPVPRARRRTAPPESDDSEQSGDDDGEERRRSLRPRRPRPHAQEHLLDLAAAHAAAPALLGQQPSPPHGGTYDSDGGERPAVLAAPPGTSLCAQQLPSCSFAVLEAGQRSPSLCYFRSPSLRFAFPPSCFAPSLSCLVNPLFTVTQPVPLPPQTAGSELSSVRLVDEAAAERQRVDLINRLVREAFPADYDGAIEGLKSLKQARITDPATGHTYGLVRLYADPGEPAAAAQRAPRAGHAVRPPKHGAGRTAGGGGGSKSAQVGAVGGRHAAAMASGVPWMLSSARGMPARVPLQHPGTFLSEPPASCEPPPHCALLLAPLPSPLPDLLQLRHHQHAAVAQGARDWAHVLQRVRHLQEDARR